MHHKRSILSSFPSVILSLHHCLEYHQTEQQVHSCILIQCKPSSSPWTIHDLSFSLRFFFFSSYFGKCVCVALHYIYFLMPMHVCNTYICGVLSASLKYTRTQSSFCPFAERTLHKCWDENRFNPKKKKCLRK